MTYEDIEELYNITPVVNLDSILKAGILCHDKVKEILHASVAMEEIQDRRAGVTLPNRRRLHSYANLYINARNPMMYVRRERHQELCVIRLDKGILLLSGVIVSDRNAATSAVRFSSGVSGLRNINEDVFAASWNHDDPLEKLRHKATMCAEVLIPDSVPPKYIAGIYVSCPDTGALVRNQFPNLDVVERPNLFFR